MRSGQSLQPRGIYDVKLSEAKVNRFSTFCVFAALAGSLHNSIGQTTNSIAQPPSPRVVASRAAPATAAKPVVTARVAPQVIARPAGVPAQRFNSNLPRTIAQPATNVRPNYSARAGISNPNVAVLNAQRSAPGQQAITVDPITRQTELRTLAAMHQRRGIVTRPVNIPNLSIREAEAATLQTMRQQRGLVTEHPNTLDPATRDPELRTLQKLREHREFGGNNQTLATINPQQNVLTHHPEAGPRPEKHESSKDPHGKKWHNKKDRIGYDEAFRRHWHESHDRNWWHDHCDTIVFVTTGYYFLDGSYWYPAYGYDPLQSYYDYDGPIYTYSDLLPDEVIANVQTALQEAGYYFGSITGSLGVDTRAALANFQRDYGLSITGAIDEATVEALGLY